MNNRRIFQLYDIKQVFTYDFNFDDFKISNFIIVKNSLFIFFFDKIEVYKVSKDSVFYSYTIDSSEISKYDYFSVGSGKNKLISAIKKEKNLTKIAFFDPENINKQNNISIDNTDISIHSFKLFSDNKELIYFTLNNGIYTFNPNTKSIEKIFHFDEKKEIILGIYKLKDIFYVFSHDGINNGTKIDLIRRNKKIKEFFISPHLSNFDSFSKDYFLSYSSYDRKIKLFDKNLKMIFSLRKLDYPRTRYLFVHNDMFSLISFKIKERNRIPKKIEIYKFRGFNG